MLTKISAWSRSSCLQSDAAIFCPQLSSGGMFSKLTDQMSVENDDFIRGIYEISSKKAYRCASTSHPHSRSHIAIDHRWLSYLDDQICTIFHLKMNLSSVCNIHDEFCHMEAIPAG